MPIYTVIFEPHVNAKARSYYNSRCEIQIDNENDPVLVVTDQLNEILLVCLNQKLIKVYGGSSPGSFSFTSRHLAGLIRISVRDPVDSTELQNMLQNLSKMDLASLPPYTGKKKIFKNLNLFKNHSLVQNVCVERKLAPAPTTPAPAISTATSSTVTSSKLEMPKSYITAKVKKQKFEFIFQSPINSVFNQRNKENTSLKVPLGTNSSYGIRSAQNSYYKQSTRNTYQPYPDFKDSPRDNDGFRNLGQTCYVAAILQLLFHSTKLRDNVLNERAFVLALLGEKCVFEAFADLFQRKLNKEFVTLKSVQSKVARFTNKFALFDQEDAHEFLMACIDQLSFENLPQELDNQDLDIDLLGKRDPIKNTIQFNLQHALSCSSCPHQSIHSEIFRDISLGLPDNAASDYISVGGLLDSFFEPDAVEYKCTCVSSNEALMGHGIETLPSTLLLHLNRFEVFGEGSVSKRLDAVHIPLSLDLSRYFLSPASQKSRYQLVGIVSHLGDSMRKGHYTFSKRDIDTGRWTDYNDSIVKRNLDEGLEKRLASQAYILAYDRISSLIQ